MKTKLTSWMRHLQARTAGNSGQTATEYLLVISVVVIAAVAVSYTYVQPFNTGVNELAVDVEASLDNGVNSGTYKGDGAHYGIAAETTSGNGEDKTSAVAGKANPFE